MFSFFLKIAGVRITYFHVPESGAEIAKIPIHTRSGKLFFKFYNDAMSGADIQGNLGIDRWAEFVIASTSGDFRNQGIAGEMYDRSIAFLKAEGYKHVLVGLTSPWTKKATQNREFKELVRMKFEDLMDFEGKPVFDKSVLGPQHVAVFSIRDL